MNPDVEGPFILLIKPVCLIFILAANWVQMFYSCREKERVAAIESVALIKAKATV